MESKDLDGDSSKGTVSKVSAGETTISSRSTGGSGVLGGSAVDFDFMLFLAFPDFDLADTTEEEAMETLDTGLVEFEPLELLLLPTLTVLFFLLLAMVGSVCLRNKLSVFFSVLNL